MEIVSLRMAPGTPILGVYSESATWSSVTGYAFNPGMGSSPPALQIEVGDMEEAASALRTRVKWYQNRRLPVPYNTAIAFNKFCDQCDYPDEGLWKRVET